MGYRLGIDLGTTYTAAAVYRDGRAEIVELGSRAASVPSVLFLRDDDEILTGDAALRRGVTDPGRLAREFKRRLGDPTPLRLGGSPYSAELLMARLLRWVVDAVSEREGGPPERITVCHPANWGPYKRELLEQALRLAELPDVDTITEPEAAAISYASTERVEEGTVVAVYDLGGGTFDAALLRKGGRGFDILGTPEGIEHLGGIDFDQAIFGHVREAAGGAALDLDPADAGALAEAARLRDEVVAAKEALSTDTEASIPVSLPNVRTTVRLTRAEFEAMIRPAIAETIAALRRAISSAGVELDQVSRVLLVGGSSRIPLVAEMVSADLGRPVAVDAHPKHAIALGAAISAAGVADETEVVTAADLFALEPTEPMEEARPSAPVPVVPAPVAPPPEEKEAPPVSPERKGRTALVAGLVVLLLAGGLGAAWAMGLFGGDEPQPKTTGLPSPSVTATDGGNGPQIPDPGQTQQTHAPTCEPSTASLSAVDNSFNPTSLSGCPGGSISFTNNGTTTHNLSIPDAGVDVDAAPGGSTTATLGELAPGDHPFSCKYHASQGMTGTLTIPA